MKQTCVVLYFSLLLVKGPFVSSEDVNGFIGGAVTLPCTYSIKNGKTTMCWGRGKCPNSKCSNPIIWTDGSRVTWNEFDTKYQLLGDIPQGDVSLTISNLSKTDENIYCCRVEIPGWFNDKTHEISVKVLEAPKSTKPALTTWSLGLTHAPKSTKPALTTWSLGLTHAPKSTKPALTTWSLGLTHAPDLKHPEYRNATSTSFTAMVPGTSNGQQQMMQIEEDLDNSDHVNPTIAGVVVLIILLVSMVGLLFTWRYYRAKNKDKSQITGTLTLEGLQAVQTQAEQNIYTL